MCARAQRKKKYLAVSIIIIISSFFFFIHLRTLYNRSWHGCKSTPFASVRHHSVQKTESRLMLLSFFFAFALSALYCHCHWKHFTLGVRRRLPPQHAFILKRNRYKREKRVEKNAETSNRFEWKISMPSQNDVVKQKSYIYQIRLGEYRLP